MRISVIGYMFARMISASMFQRQGTQLSSQSHSMADSAPKSELPIDLEKSLPVKREALFLERVQTLKAMS